MTAQPLPLIGWREWGLLPDIVTTPIKIKVDTGAKTSCLHAFKIKPFTRKGQAWIRFWLHPQQDSTDEVICESPVFDRRYVTDSGGHKQLRYVIQSTLILGPHQFTIELTLTNRDNMKFRMLLGRRALAGRFVVDSQASFLTGATQ
ncbi:ATP-dependent zinc protease [Shewanella sp. NIFS-20-20]|uniref:ATP-dependent zinc protease family protein n=1 Tax=Shewanella sp. NIFS-20-20 TaxID=2853806 RepID=UPI001C46DD1A|nr:ATP-dependent zinc protease [Shewanella sp. NIFS-20-20]MBV7315404.1 ATP-dependent zinc protease [Shewanella sp. NIFS-20-20]